MRIVFIGLGDTTIHTARYLIEKGHQVVIIDKNREKIDGLSEEIDCSFLHGDGSKPKILKEVAPEETNMLFCMTDDDQDNIIAGLVARSLGFKRVIITLENQEYEAICRELNLNDVINPSQTISRYLADMTEGLDILELTTMVKGDVRFFSFIMRKEDECSITELDLPAESRVIYYYRTGSFKMAEDGDNLKKGDELVILTHRKNLEILNERWKPNSQGKSTSKEKDSG
jgi:trk system potassium uptake protein TrkA